MFRRILVAYDGSEGARAALRMGIGLAKSPGTELYSISVEEHLPCPTTPRRSARSRTPGSGSPSTSGR